MVLQFQTSKWVTLGFGALCLVAVAGVLNASHLYYMAAILLTLPGVSYALGWYALRGLKFTRELPPSAWDGEEGDLIYAVTNHSRISRYFLQIQEPLPPWIQLLEEETPLFNVAANETARVVHRVEFLKRGVYKVDSFEVTAMDPLGVFAFSKQVDCAGELIVYPMPQQMRSMPLSGAERYGFQEFTALALRGSSVDPDGVREYVPGDPLRRIHWRQTARTGKLSVIEFEESQSVNLVIALDLLRGTDIGAETETTLEYAVRLVASLAHQATQQNISVRLLASPPPAEEVGRGALEAVATSGRGQEHFYLLLDALARVEANALHSVSEVIAENTGALLPGTSLLVITANPDPALAASLARYTATGANVMVIYIDPNTFEGGRNRVRPDKAQTFFADLTVTGARVFTVRQNAQSYISPEAMTDADIRTPQPSLA